MDFEGSCPGPKQNRELAGMSAVTDLWLAQFDGAAANANRVCEALPECRSYGRETVTGEQFATPSSRCVGRLSDYRI